MIFRLKQRISAELLLKQLSMLSVRVSVRLERGQMIEEFKSKNQELITAKVDRIDPDTGNVTLDMGKNSAVLPKTEQVPEEHFTVGENIKVFVVDVKEMGKGPRIMISRTHPGMVRRLFEQEVLKFMTAQLRLSRFHVRQVQELRLQFIQQMRMLTL